MRFPISVVMVAATPFACTWDRAGNLDRAEAAVRQAAAQGANIVLLQELFETPYFCKDQKADFFDLAAPVDEHPVVDRMRALAADLGVVLPASVFERAGTDHYNSIVMIDSDGRVFGVYGKSHIPDGPGHQEMYYFTPGDTGFRVFKTRFSVLGAAVCWDQWFPEAARSMVLMSAEILFYPTAIGSEPHDPTIDSRCHWQRVMQGHAGANLVPLVASNLIGHEEGETCSLTFYGTSFIACPHGEIVAEAPRDEPVVITASFDLDAVRRTRTAWGVFRDRRPDLYAPILTSNGRSMGPSA